MSAQWQRNQSGTQYADYLGKRISVRRSAPRKREFVAKIEGALIGTFSDMLTALQAAELAAEQRAGVE